MNLNQKRMSLFEKELHEKFDLKYLLIEDESHLHAGHLGAASGGGHFKITIVSPEFARLSLLARHRAIYQALNSHFPQEIHALTIIAYTPEEFWPQ
jgi:BolA family transcriptional regulator, general stress-responsive regulator